MYNMCVISGLVWGLYLRLYYGAELLYRIRKSYTEKFPFSGQGFWFVYSKKVYY